MYKIRRSYDKIKNKMYFFILLNKHNNDVYSLLKTMTITVERIKYEQNDV